MHATEPSEIDNAVRKERRKRKLGSNDKCAHCPECRRPAIVPGETKCRNCQAGERWEKAGKPDTRSSPKCAWCGESHPATLEWHHIYGRATNADVGQWLCKNDHAVATAWQIDYAVSFTEQTTVLAYAINVLRAEAAYLVAVEETKATVADLRRRAEMYADMADRLAKFRDGLTTRLPEWEDIPEAKP